MIHIGNAITVRMLQNGIAEFHFNSQENLVNKFDHATLEDFKAALDAIDSQKDIQGLIVTFAKAYSALDAEVKTYMDYCTKDEITIHDELQELFSLLNRLEALPLPTVAVISENLIGSGFDIALVCNYRVISNTSKLGFLTTDFGVLPNFGATTRLPRLIGLEAAAQFFTAKVPLTLESAQAYGLVDTITHEEKIIPAALDIIQHAIHGEFDWKKERKEKNAPLQLSPIEQFIAFHTIKTKTFSQNALMHNPASKLLLNTLQNSVLLNANEAFALEIDYFAQAIKRPQIHAVIGSLQTTDFYNTQILQYADKATPITHTALLGTNISASQITTEIATRNKSVLLKVSTAEEGNQAIESVRDRLYKKLEKHEISIQEVGNALCQVHPTYSYESIVKVDFVIESLNQHPKSKVQAIKEVESQIVTRDTIIASNTSTISITRLAKTLQRPTQFIGMHFLGAISNHQCVEVVYGEETSQETIATSMTFAKALGKIPILIKDGAGFFIYRTLFPYLNAFENLVEQGIDFQKIDHTMETFGWHIGPAAMIDQLGTHQFMHMAELLSESYPERMQNDFHGVTSLLHRAERFGYQSCLGFYQYKNQTNKLIDTAVYEIIDPLIPDERETLSHHEIIDRMMLALCNETIRCLEDKTIYTAYEADLAMSYIGFPNAKGGPCRYIEQMGIKEYIALCNTYTHLGKIYEAPQMLHDLAEKNQSLFRTGEQ
ncbi:3-hydroxyacyl-CoA dehydrogenase NAD-binding domain-containing protein [Acinetobacter nectaris]|uniref:3-hydroxyacyl-CoA dehydrogenase NAD-binding domain-containing protein n=1 Tax=Acinetobacter nectaris TaxID=1219382 RepID=UPI001F1CEA5C|nr:3-hydroxyacyl-CoA dehydrogenase NAD-binding domain-containing protein [Acinetobacter nectaris]MCF9000105.1 enoyl-CoA hydratase/isomerase family protein [Acinetobacter nectaris]MCF9027143.1 enoyl-CoA hydratase/isomerase family protein [Acinetobacter nectaris]